jgi:hypothetical protein
MNNNLNHILLKYKKQSDEKSLKKKMSSCLGNLSLLTLHWVKELVQTPKIGYSSQKIIP